MNQIGKRNSPYFSDNPLISIVTISRNAGTTIHRTIESVVNQSYNNVEYILIDGGSTDDTVDKILTYQQNLSFFLSEPDHGISDAFNKGISVCNGEIIGLLNADDWYPKGTLQEIATNYLKNRTKIFHGNLVFHKRSFKKPKTLRPRIDQLSRTMALFHPTVFIPKVFYEKGGLFRNELKVAMDYDLLLRFLNYGFQYHYIDRELAEMSDGGFSQINWKTGFKEVELIRRNQGLNATVSKTLYAIETLIKVLKTSINRFIN